MSIVVSGKPACIIASNGIKPLRVICFITTVAGGIPVACFGGINIAGLNKTLTPQQRVVTDIV